MVELGKGTKRHTFPVIKEVRSEEAMCSAGNTGEDSITSHGHRGQRGSCGDRARTHVNAESPCCTPAITPVMCVSYVSIKKKIF